MRSTPVKSDKKSTKKALNKTFLLKRNMSVLKPPTRDTISETISFVIKGKLTPIKPFLIENKIDLIKKVRKSYNNTTGKIVKQKNRRSNRNPDKQFTKKLTENSKAKTKVQIKTAKKSSAQPSNKKQIGKLSTDVIIQTPKTVSKNNSKSELLKKNQKKKPAAKAPKTERAKKEKPKESLARKPRSKVKIKTQDENDNRDDIVKLILAEEIQDHSRTKKVTKTSKRVPKLNMVKVQKRKPAVKRKPKLKLKSPDRNQNFIDPVIKASSAKVDSEVLQTIKSEILDSSNEAVSEDIPLSNLALINDFSAPIKKIKVETSCEKAKPSIPPKKKSYKKIKTKPKITIIKKRVMTAKAKDEQEDQKHRTKLFGFWNGPKHHRVASLNALAKVHCLYENETRSNLFDIIDESSKLAYSPKRDINKQEKDIKQEAISTDRDDTPSPLPTRTLRSVPGLRAIGKHWDMQDSTSSSDENSDFERPPEVRVRKERVKKHQPVKDKDLDERHKEKKRSRKRNELIMEMDLKDMVVRKRMASLNASAILAASYSFEKRPAKTVKEDEDSDYTGGSSDEYFAASDNEIKQEVDAKVEDTKLMEVRATPNKKVAVILNQDTDVTITGVYVNSTTRSTHHEGYCSIAGMQYRISATSHTQTAATVATETLLQSSSSSGPENSNSEPAPPSKSYTPLDALSNMQPPPGPGIQHNHPVQHMGPPQHVIPIPPHQLSPGRRHGCSSAFSSPHPSPNYHPPPSEPGYVQAGYYQPAGPLITVPHGHAPPTPSVSLPDVSPSSTATSTHEPTPSKAHSTNEDSSDSEVIITSVSGPINKEPINPIAPPSTSHPSYRYPQYPPPAPHPHSYSYAYAPPYHYPPAYASHHELCGPPTYVQPKYPGYRRYLSASAAPQYYPPPGSHQEMYHGMPPGGAVSQQNQQVVSAPSQPPGGPGAVGVPSPYPPPAPQLHEQYGPPQPPALVDSYQPPGPAHYYPYGGCYTHAPARAVPYLNATYQSCPCPVQSCPKNVLTGPLTGDSKRSNHSSISKDSMPLPPVALALPLEPASATGPPSPARGSAGMPPPPSPAGATYQPPPHPTKQESQSPGVEEYCKTEKKRKARIGKAMVRNTIAANMPQSTMLLMCNPIQNYATAVKREIESPKEKEFIPQKKEICSSDEETKPLPETFESVYKKPDEAAQDHPAEIAETKEEKRKADLENGKEINIAEVQKIEELLQPVVSTVAENVKVKNMKRKLSLSKERVPEPDLASTPNKKQKLSSYKHFIKKETNTIKINNGKRKLIEETQASLIRRTNPKQKKQITRRKIVAGKGDTNKRLKICKPLRVSNSNNPKHTTRLKHKPLMGSQSRKIEEPPKKLTKKQPVNSKCNSKSAPAVLDSLFAKNNVDRTIESVISEVCVRTPKEICTVKSLEKCGRSVKDPSEFKKSTNNKIGQTKVKVECKKNGANRRKSKSSEVLVAQAITKVPRRSLVFPRWSNGWRWEGEPYEAKVFVNSDELTVVRKCYPAMRHEEGDALLPRDCVLLKAGARKNELPFVAKIASLWENPEDGEMMMSLLWYYRPEHTEQGRLPTDQPDEVFASRHKDSNSVACIDDKCYVLTFSEYCRYRKRYKRIEEGIEETLPCIPNPEPYPRSHRQPPSSQISPEMVFFCRRVYDFRQKKNY